MTFIFEAYSRHNPNMLIDHMTLAKKIEYKKYVYYQFLKQHFSIENLDMDLIDCEDGFKFSYNSNGYYWGEYPRAIHFEQEFSYTIDKSKKNKYCDYYDPFFQVMLIAF